MLVRFRRYAYAQYQRTLTHWETLLLAREHGLPVRLLDWTTNPLVALYFASLFQSSPSADAALWVLVRKRRKSHFDGSLVEVFDGTDPLQVNGVRVVYPMAISERVIAQSGVLTIQANPYTDLQELSSVEFSDDDLDAEAILKWTIPEASRRAIVHELEQFDVNARRLFPDFDGLCCSLWQSEALKDSRGQYADFQP